MVFDSFHHGFRLSVHPFLQGVLHHYDISFCNLNPNSILRLAIFVELCESFLGIDPHFNLSCHFFFLQPLWSKVVGRCGLQLHDGKVAEYISVPLPSSNKGWHSG
ncbi:hypothetical protein GUJ93_ZPchr0013g37873 [Zizania palustris]|uniref:Transposase (putative) gypsy type domain-containing protein n=1 Tax=Zizania palustris TaxID=103762 RepID=A0A8J5X2A4_ZIZPA|nr:hypothetical protein GUJ93_ZPchr0013g37873 [Zizania palustris]